MLTVNILYSFYLSSAFNTIQPALLRGKLEGARVDQHLAALTTDFLTNRRSLSVCETQGLGLRCTGALGILCSLPSFSPATHQTSCTTL